jgi:hypothetical protein
MTSLDDLERIIRKYLRTGLTVVIMLVAPGADMDGILGPEASGSELLVVGPDGGTGRPGTGAPAGGSPSASDVPLDARVPLDDPEEGDEGTADDTDGDTGSQDDGTGEAGDDDPKDAERAGGNTDTRSGGSDGSTTTSGDRYGTPRSGTSDPQPTAGPTPAPGSGNEITTAPVPDGTSTAADRLGWGVPDQADEFEGPLSGWTLYSGTGYEGRGARSPEAATVRDGILTLTGDAEGTTAGMAWGGGQRYGRWEARVRAPVSDPTYDAVLLLWPDSDDARTGGEIDFAEIQDPRRQSVAAFVHGPAGQQIGGLLDVDATEWHHWAVEWTPEGVVAYVDGQEWFRTTDTAALPPGPMHLCVQLDWFPGETTTAPQESRMEVDWVRQWSLPPGG